MSDSLIGVQAGATFLLLAAIIWLLLSSLKRKKRLDRQTRSQLKWKLEALLAQEKQIAETLFRLEEGAPLDKMRIQMELLELL